MAAALSLDLRARVIAAVDAGTSCREAAERFGVGHASAVRWYARYRVEGAIAAKPMGEASLGPARRSREGKLAEGEIGIRTGSRPMRP